MLKSLKYNVFYQASAAGTYTIQDIVVDVILQDSLTLDGTTYCKVDTTGKAVPSKQAFYSFNQRFAMEFTLSRKNVSNYSIDAIAQSGLLAKSGNPGYLIDQPLLVS